MLKVTNRSPTQLQPAQRFLEGQRGRFFGHPMGGGCHILGVEYFSEQGLGWDQAQVDPTRPSRTALAVPLAARLTHPGGELVRTVGAKVRVACRAEQRPPASWGSAVWGMKRIASHPHPRPFETGIFCSCLGFGS